MCACFVVLKHRGAERQRPEEEQEAAGEQQEEEESAAGLQEISGLCSGGRSAGSETRGLYPQRLLKCSSLKEEKKFSGGQ